METQTFQFEYGDEWRLFRTDVENPLNGVNVLTTAMGVEAEPFKNISLKVNQVVGYNTDSIRSMKDYYMEMFNQSFVVDSSVKLEGIKVSSFYHELNSLDEENDTTRVYYERVWLIEGANKEVTFSVGSFTESSYERGLELVYPIIETFEFKN